MKNNQQKGFVVPLIIFAISLVLVGTGINYYLNYPLLNFSIYKNRSGLFLNETSIQISATGSISGVYPPRKEVSGTLDDNGLKMLQDLFLKYDVINLKDAETKTDNSILSCDGGQDLYVSEDEKKIWSSRLRCGECYPKKSCEFSAELSKLIDWFAIVYTVDKTPKITTEIGDLLWSQNLSKSMSWGEAIAGCSDLGENWRLPERFELLEAMRLQLLDKGRKEPTESFFVEDNFKTYWSGTVYEEILQKHFSDYHPNAYSGFYETESGVKKVSLFDSKKTTDNLVRCVKNKNYTTTKKTKVDNQLLKWSTDLGKKPWGDAVIACSKLGIGWRLPDRGELTRAVQEQFSNSGVSEWRLFLKGSGYWSSTESDDDYYAWASGISDSLMVYGIWDDKDEEYSIICVY